jgi:hypothetical protein
MKILHVLFGLYLDTGTKSGRGFAVVHTDLAQLLPVHLFAHQSDSMQRHVKYRTGSISELRQFKRLQHG